MQYPKCKLVKLTAVSGDPASPMATPKLMYADITTVIQKLNTLNNVNWSNLLQFQAKAIFC